MTKEREALKLALEVLEQMEKADVWQVGNAIAAINKALAQPEQEPVAWLYFHNRAEPQLDVQLEEPDCIKSFPDDVVWKKPLYTTPPQRKPQFKEFIKWAGAQGYDCAQTCNSDTGEWIVLNPMTADLWKAWQAAQGIKE